MKSNIITNKIDFFRNEPNYKLKGTTFDCQHLNRFLSKSEYCRPLIKSDNYNNYISGIDSARSSNPIINDNSLISENPINLSKFSNLLTNPNPNSKKLTNNNSSMLSSNQEKSIFIRNLSYPRLNDFSEHFSKLNPLVSPPSKINKNPDFTFLNAGTTSLKKNNLIDSANLDISCVNSKEYRKLVTEYLDTQRSEQENKKNKILMTKQNRILKNDYKSGILNVDSPQNEESFLYTDESKYLKTNETRIHEIKKRRENLLAEKTSSNEKILFSNNFTLKKKIELPSYNPNNNSPSNNMNIQDEKDEFRWKRKKYHTETFDDKKNNTHDHIFSMEQPKYSLERAKYLREKDVGFRDYNIIAETDNSIEIRRREILKLLD